MDRLPQVDRAGHLQHRLLLRQRPRAEMAGPPPGPARPRSHAAGPEEPQMPAREQRAAARGEAEGVASTAVGHGGVLCHAFEKTWSNAFQADRMRFTSEPQPRTDGIAYAHGWWLIPHFGDI